MQKSLQEDEDRAYRSVSGRIKERVLESIVLSSWVFDGVAVREHRRGRERWRENESQRNGGGSAQAGGGLESLQMYSIRRFLGAHLCRNSRYLLILGAQELSGRK